MKAVKIWGYILVAMIPVLYIIGAITGDIPAWGDITYYGLKIETALFFFSMAVCLLLAISMFVVACALEQLQRRDDN